MKFPKKSNFKCTAVSAIVIAAGSAQLVWAGDLDSCMNGLRGAAQGAGVSANTLDRYTQGLNADMTVLEKLDQQPEFKMPVWDYLSGLVDEERVADGRRGLAQHAETLRRVESQFGVDPATVAAVWGVESNFGRTQGKYSLVQALGTLSCMGRRQAYFRTEFFATLRILQGGHVTADRLMGSWAGAFGQTQFMPSTYERLAVDFDGDGRKDLIDSVPDALASTANFLAKGGWQRGMPWGFEVKVPPGYSGSSDRKSKQSLSSWASMGMRRADGQDLMAGLSGSTPAGLLAPAGMSGPVFLVFRNFEVIYGYNASESYALAIAHLSDRLRGGAPFATPWPTDDPGLSRAERRELQSLLQRRGYDIGEIDGMLGEKSRAAILKEQSRLGQNTNGRAGQKLLRQLRMS